MKTIGFGCALLLAVSLAPARANAERGSDSERKVTIQAPQVNTCKSGCASITRPDSPKEDKFTRLFRRFAGEKLLPGSEALETLLFFGPETRKRLAEGAGKELPATHRSFLSRELSRTHATLWIRIVDRKGKVRVSLGPKQVEIGHHFHFHADKGQRIQIPVFSGRVERVGVRHLWTRF